MAVMVMVHKKDLNQTVEVLMKLQNYGSSRDHYSETYDINMADMMIDGGNVEERFRNAYQIQVQYYTNRVCIKTIGLTEENDIFKCMKGPEFHEGRGNDTLPQEIIREIILVDEGCRQSENLARKTQAMGKL